jgi:hypothetical protein
MTVISGGGAVPVPGPDVGMGLELVRVVDTLEEKGEEAQIEIPEWDDSPATASWGPFMAEVHTSTPFTDPLQLTTPDLRPRLAMPLTSSSTPRRPRIPSIDSRIQRHLPNMEEKQRSLRQSAVLPSNIRYRRILLVIILPYESRGSRSRALVPRDTARLELI